MPPVPRPSSEPEPGTAGTPAAAAPEAIDTSAAAVPVVEPAGVPAPAHPDPAAVVEATAAESPEAWGRYEEALKAWGLGLEQQPDDPELWNAPAKLRSLARRARERQAALGG